LTDADLLKLKKVAKYYFLYGTSQGRDAEDLLQEAIVAILSGKRRWPRNVSLFQVLLGAMRSIADGWRRKKTPDLILESDLSAFNEAGVLAEEQAASNPEVTYLKKEQTVSIIRRLSQCDPIAFKIVIFLGSGFEAKEVQAKLSISATEYDAAKKRIKRKLNLLPSKNNLKLNRALQDVLRIHPHGQEESINDLV
jgi:DNA-directed RNA polymerase specialized sigma24 family protein